MLDFSYDDLSELVNESYLCTGDIRETMKETGLNFDEVWEMTGMKDWFDWDPPSEDLEK